MADSAEIADCTDRAFALIAESLASCEYPHKARKPIVAKIARIVITTISSTNVKPNFFQPKIFFMFLC